MANVQDGATTRDLPLRGSNADAESFEYVSDPHENERRLRGCANVIVATYHRLLKEDPDLTMPMAAIEALIEFLGHSQVKTVYETIDLVKTQSEKLQAAVRNPIALSHGTDLFSQYLIMSLKQPASSSSASNGGSSSKLASPPLDNPHESFEVVRQHLLRNSRLFATRAKNARERIAANGRKHLHDDTTILTMGGSRVVGNLLSRAAAKHDYGWYTDPPRRFRVLYAVDPALQAESDGVVQSLRAQGIQVATIPFTALAYAMGQVDKVIVGAEAVTANGGIISSMGTYSLAVLAKASRKPLYVAAEQHKFGKTFPVDNFDFNFDQEVINFYSDNNKEDKAKKVPMPDPVDFTPPELIEAFFADHKVLTPDEVAKEVIDMLM
ncbi:translation initiation factor-like protein eif-2b subunit alpha [Apiospora hydei]|uniref:Translation initiation factor eIF2B subunit alpha n=1 Tax=Apiospora hydei TaxID=1337664 RepID=A0ABR1WA78_9PEZI